MMRERNYDLFFETLSNRLRMDIIMELEKEPLSVGSLSRRIGEEQSKVSHSLEALRACQLVHSKNSGRSRIYHLNRESIMPILKLVDAHVCKNCAHGCEKIVMKDSRHRARKGS